MAKIDIGSKQTIHSYSKAWLEWQFKQPVTVEAELTSEFRFIARLTDSLLRVKLGVEDPFLALTELQWKHDQNMPERLMAYAALARQKYHLEVFVTVVYLTPPPNSETGEETPLLDTCHHEFRGQRAHQDFQVISLWEQNAKDILALNNPALLPFLPLTKGGDKKSLLRACVKRIRQEPLAQAEELENFLAALASHVFDITWLRQLLRWNMELLRDSPLFQELLVEERQRISRLEEALEETGQQNRELTRKTQELSQEMTQKTQKLNQELTRKTRELSQERYETLSNILRLRFGKLPKTFARQLGHLEAKVLRRLNQVALTVNSLAEFEKMLALAKK